LKKAENTLPQRLQKALLLLETHQGVKSWPGFSDPLECLALTILSQNTNDRLRDIAFDRLKKRFPEWEQVMQAPVEQVQETIQIAGLSRQKSARLQEVLRWIKVRFEELSLEALQELSNDEAMELLTSRKGIGVKTAAVVLLVALGRDLCPVDTHVHRLAGRLGWVPPSTNAEKTFQLLQPAIPRGGGYSLHMNLLQFGRTICQARKPLCLQCFLWDDCPWEGKSAPADQRKRNTTAIKR
jgi:endonuclease-3